MAQRICEILRAGGIEVRTSLSNGERAVKDWLKNSRRTVRVRPSTGKTSSSFGKNMIEGGYITEVEFEQDLAQLEEANFLAPSAIMWTAWGRRPPA